MASKSGYIQALTVQGLVLFWLWRYICILLAVFGCLGQDRGISNGLEAGNDGALCFGPRLVLFVIVHLFSIPKFYPSRRKPL
jgi:hypothetical protein